MTAEKHKKKTREGDTSTLKTVNPTPVDPVKPPERGDGVKEPAKQAAPAKHRGPRGDDTSETIVVSPPPSDKPPRGDGDDYQPKHGPHRT
jgi:hypothetical protein